MTINVYTDVGVRVFTPLIWQEFFTKYMPTVNIHYVKGIDILKHNPDAILFPGGSGSAFSKAIIKQDIIDWVRGGGKYIGVCAGAYLASSSYDWSLGLSNITINKKWRRGKHIVKLNINDNIKDVEFFNGPLLTQHEDIKIIGTYENGIPNNLSESEFIGSPAIYSNDYGNGKILLISPHLERSNLLKDDLCDLITNLLIYK